MVEFASKNDEDELKSIWKNVFHDTDFYIDLYFVNNFVPNNTLIFKNNKKIASMLFMRPYQFCYWGENILCYYLSGLATLPEFRNQKIMSQLLTASDTIMKKRNIPLAILIPAGDKMFNFYGKFDFVKVFEKDCSEIPLRKLIENHNYMLDSFAEFEKIYMKENFCIKKKFADFQAIIREWEYEQRPIKTNVAGMAKLIDPHLLFNIYLKKTGNNIKLNIENPQNAILQNGELTVNIKQLCILLFGVCTSQLSEEFAAAFPEHNPILNLMLE
ncbi:MAG: GNAT family N-acetyltransferase [Paludibacter sp.]|nr:GNAT family N-acetyltransferase [Paludibacter sp.]